MPSFSFLSDIDFRRRENRELEDLQDILLAQHSTMSLLLNRMEDEDDEDDDEDFEDDDDFEDDVDIEFEIQQVQQQQEGRPPSSSSSTTVFKCPVCSEAYPKESLEYSNQIPSVQHRCSHGATIIFVTAPCPICMEDTYPTIALRCGHVLCRVDFERMGGGVGQPQPEPDTNTTAPDTTRRPRVVRGPATNTILGARSAGRGGMRWSDENLGLEETTTTAGDNINTNINTNVNTNTNAVQVQVQQASPRIQLARPTFLSRYLQEDSDSDHSENENEDDDDEDNDSNHTGASEDTERLLQSVAEYAARAADSNRQLPPPYEDPEDDYDNDFDNDMDYDVNVNVDYGPVRPVVPHTTPPQPQPPREPTSRSSPAQWALTWPTTTTATHRRPYISRTRQEILSNSPMIDYHQADHGTFATSPRITPQEDTVVGRRPRQGPRQGRPTTGSRPFVDFRQFGHAVWDMSSSSRGNMDLDSVESPKIWALIPDMDDSTKLELVHVGFSECFPCGQFPSGTKIFSADRDLVNCSNRICIQTPPERNNRGSCRIRCIEVDHDDEEVDTVYEYSTPKTKQVVNDAGNGVWALIQNRLYRFHREYPEGKQILSILNCHLIADKESSVGWDPGNAVWVHSLDHREGVHTDLDPGLWIITPNQYKCVVPNLHSRAKIIGSDKGLWVLEPHSTIPTGQCCLLRHFTVKGAVHEDFVVHVPFQHVQSIFMGGHVDGEAETVYPVRLHCRIRNQWSLCKVRRQGGTVHSYSECRKDSLVMDDGQGGTWVFRKPAGRREKKLYHIGAEGQVQEIVRRWFPARSILAI